MHRPILAAIILLTFCGFGEKVKISLFISIYFFFIIRSGLGPRNHFSALPVKMIDCHVVGYAAAHNTKTAQKDHKQQRPNTEKKVRINQKPIEFFINLLFVGKNE